MIAGLAAIYHWTPDYVLDRLTMEDAIAFLRAGARFYGIEMPPPKVVASPDWATAYQEPDRAGFARIVRGG